MIQWNVQPSPDALEIEVPRPQTTSNFPSGSIWINEFCGLWGFMLGVGPPQRNQVIWCAPKIPDAILADHNTTFWQSTHLRWLRWLTHIYFAPCLTIESKFQILRSKSTMEHPVFIQLIPWLFLLRTGSLHCHPCSLNGSLGSCLPKCLKLLRGFPCELPSLAMLCILTCQRLVSCTPRLDGLWEKKQP